MAATRRLTAPPEHSFIRALPGTGTVHYRLMAAKAAEFAARKPEQPQTGTRKHPDAWRMAASWHSDLSKTVVCHHRKGDFPADTK
ncbi:MAG: hypothetical protein OXF74_08920 [Rhodobacteraceae bacterium]|nr:hypothetical protein [Paracoccaceae bacterium]